MSLSTIHLAYQRWAGGMVCFSPINSTLSTLSCDIAHGVILDHCFFPHTTMRLSRKAIHSGGVPSFLFQIITVVTSHRRSIRIWFGIQRGLFLLRHEITPILVDPSFSLDVAARLIRILFCGFLPFLVVPKLVR